MGMVADIVPYHDYLFVHVAGSFSLDEANAVIVRIFKAITQYAMPRVLIDCRQVKGNPTTTERFEHAEFVSREGGKTSSTDVVSHPRLAYVGLRPLIEREHFGETVAINRGVAVKETDSMEEALLWLRVNPAHNTSLQDMPA